MITKTCTKCDTKFYAIKTEHFIKHFPKRKASRDGFSYHCKKCTNEYKRLWQQKSGYKKKKKPLLDKECLVCSKPFQTRRETTTTCGKECSLYRKKVYIRLERRNSNYSQIVKKKRNADFKKSKKARKHYSQDELEVIKNLMDKMPITKIAKKINRPYYGTYSKVQEFKKMLVKMG